MEDGNGHGSSINLDNSTFLWSDGDLSTKMGYGHVYVYNGSTLDIEDNASHLGAALVIGQDQNKNGSKGVLNIATLTDDMNSNLILERNATITNFKDGIVNFDQAKRSSSRGGISAATDSSLSTITNYGTMNRNVQDPLAGNLLNIAVPVLQDAAGAVFNLGPSCGINFSGTGGLNLKQGTFNKDPSAKQKGVNPKGGKLVGMATDASGTDSYYALAGLPATAGFVSFDDSAGAVRQPHRQRDFHAGLGCRTRYEGEWNFSRCLRPGHCVRHGDSRRGTQPYHPVELHCPRQHHVYSDR